MVYECGAQKYLYHVRRNLFRAWNYMDKTRGIYVRGKRKIIVK